MPANHKCDVLVVGAGPAGLFLAGELRRQGVNSRLVDKNCQCCEHARATSIQPRTLEIFEQIGLLDPFLAHGNRIDGVKTFVEGNRLVDHRVLKDLESPFPFEISLPQSRTEQLLIDYLAGRGQAVERNVELLSFQQNDAGVRAKLRHAGEVDEIVDADFLVGCDGSHSTIRHQLGMHLEGTDYPATFAVADVAIDGPIEADEVRLYCSATEGIFVAPLPEGRFLIAFDLPDGQPPPSAGSAPQLNELQEYFDRAGPGNLRLHDPAWTTYFHCHRRLVPHYQVGRVFLAGDAAHVQSPTGGQGMNTGFQDGFNLAWKLALVLRGASRSSLLQSYHEERHYIGQQMLALSDRMHQNLFQHHPPLRTRVGKWVAAHFAHYGLMHPRQRTVDETRIGYHHSSIVREHLPAPANPSWKLAPRAGDRAPDVALSSQPGNRPTRLFELIREPRHHAILLEGKQSQNARRNLRALAADVTARYRGLVEPLLIHYGDVAMDGAKRLWHDPQGDFHRHYGADGPSVYVIRPDGYVGFRSPTTDADSLHGYLSKILV